MIKQLGRCLGKYKKESILTPIFVILEVLMEVLIPLIMASMIDLGIEVGNLNVILKFGMILVLFAVIALVFGVLSGNFAAKASCGFAKNLRQKIYYRIQDFSFFNIDKFSTSSLVTRLTTDVTNVQNSFQMIIRVAVRAPIMLVFSLIMAIIINKKLSLIFIIVIPFLGTGLYLILNFVQPLFKKVFRTYDKLNNVVQENLRGIRVVKSFVREEYEKKKFNSVSSELFQNFIKAEKIISFNSPLMQFSMYISTLLISWFGAKLIISSTMTTGELISLISYTSQILMSLMMLSMIFVMLSMSRTSAERICEILDEESDLKNLDKPVYEMKNGDIRFKDVYFSYLKGSDEYCISDINLEIKSGETIGIIGATGSGKSTLIQLIPRLYDTSKGIVYVGGVDVREYDIKTLRENVGVVLQKNTLFSGTIKENLRWGNKYATDNEIVDVCKLAQADDFIRKFSDGYDTHIEQGGTNVSGGQKQRLSIARALLKNPKILILDDSTSAVDTKTDSLIREAFRKNFPNTTKIIIGQRINSIMDSDKIIIMNDGKIDDIGTHEELLKNNTIYKEIYTSQMKEMGDSDEAI